MQYMEYIYRLKIERTSKVNDRQVKRAKIDVLKLKMCVCVSIFNVYALR